jgi:hypothetical protein
MTDLADGESIERRAQCGGQLGGDLYASACEADHDDRLVTIAQMPALGQRRRKRASRSAPICKPGSVQRDRREPVHASMVEHRSLRRVGENC